MLTLFTAPKPFQGHIGTIQANAIRSWIALGADVEILLVGDDPGVAEAASEFSVRHLPGVRRAESGAPSLRSTFDGARRAARYPILCYLNADIMLLDDFLPAVAVVVRQLDRFLVVGQRWDLDVGERLKMEAGWQMEMRQRMAAAGTLHRPVGSDYFVFPVDQYPDLPDFTVGRTGWDNWMIFDGRRRRIPVIDASRAITIVHQNHDYAHLPGGIRPHYHPESQRNVAAAGGRKSSSAWKMPIGPADGTGAQAARVPLSRRWEADRRQAGTRPRGAPGAHAPSARPNAAQLAGSTRTSWPEESVAARQ
jgi:hypothetical protein